VLIIGESCIGAFLLILLLQFYPCYYLALSFYSCTCWVPSISVLNLAIFSCYSNLLLRRRGWTGILRRRVLGYMLPWLSFLWCYGVFRYSVPLRVITVFRDTVYIVIIILYSWNLFICEHFWLYVWNNWSWVMHTMSTWFWNKWRVKYRCISYSFILVITLHYHFISALAEYQPSVYSTSLFSPATQTCCSEGEDGLKFFDEEF
jgi:hypothetical protein